MAKDAFDEVMEILTTAMRVLDGTLPIEEVPPSFRGLSEDEIREAIDRGSEIVGPRKPMN